MFEYDYFPTIIETDCKNAIDLLVMMKRIASQEKLMSVLAPT
jgi:hypothetical protein